MKFLKQNLRLTLSLKRMMAVLLKDCKRDHQSGAPGVFQGMKGLLAWCSPVPVAQDNCGVNNLFPSPGSLTFVHFVSRHHPPWTGLLSQQTLENNCLACYLHFITLNVCLTHTCVECVILHLGFWREEGGANLAMSWWRNECPGRRSSLLSWLHHMEGKHTGWVLICCLGWVITCSCAKPEHKPLFLCFTLPCSAGVCITAYNARGSLWPNHCFCWKQNLSSGKDKTLCSKPSHFLLLFIVNSAL